MDFPSAKDAELEAGDDATAEPPPTLSPCASVVGSVSRRVRGEDAPRPWGLLFVYMLYSLLLGPCVLNWTPIADILFNSNAYGWLCPDAQTQTLLDVGSNYSAKCIEQEKAVHRLFTVVLCSLFFFSILAGILVDRFGPKLTAIFGVLCMYCGWVLIAVSRQHMNTYVLGCVMFGLGFDSSFYPLLSVVKRFPGKTSMVISILGASRSCSYIVPLILRFIYFNSSISLQMLFLIWWSAVVGVCLCVAAFLVPWTNFPTPPVCGGGDVQSHTHDDPHKFIIERQISVVSQGLSVFSQNDMIYLPKSFAEDCADWGIDFDQPPPHDAPPPHARALPLDASAEGNLSAHEFLTTQTHTNMGHSTNNEEEVDGALNAHVMIDIIHREPLAILPENAQLNANALFPEIACGPSPDFSGVRAAADTAPATACVSILPHEEAPISKDSDLRVGDGGFRQRLVDFKSSVSGLLCEVVSPRFYVLVIVASFNFLNFIFYVPSAVHLIPSAYRANQVIQALPFLIAPGMGFLADKFGIISVMHLGNICSICAHTFLLIPRIPAHVACQYISSVCNVVRMSFVMSQIYCYGAACFNPKYTGRLIGLACTFAGVAVLISNEMIAYSVAHTFYPMLSLTICFAVVNVPLIAILGWVKKHKPTYDQTLIKEIIREKSNAPSRF